MEMRASEHPTHAGGLVPFSLFLLTLCSDDLITDDLLIEVRASEHPTHTGDDLITDDLLMEVRASEHPTHTGDDLITDDLLVKVWAGKSPTHIENDCVTDDLLVETETYPRCANGVFLEEVVESSQEMAVQCAFRNVTRWLNALSYQTSGDVREFCARHSKLLT
jgi:ribosomal protein L31